MPYQDVLSQLLFKDTNIYNSFQKRTISQRKRRKNLRMKRGK
jgi:hypothetical protein